MTRHSTVRRSDLPDRLRKKLDALAPRVHGVAAATAIWSNIFSDADRKALGGDNYAAWKQCGGTAGMWAVVREVSHDQAIVEIAYTLDWLDTQTANEILKFLAGAHSDARKPRWLKDKRELWFDGEIIRQIRDAKRAKNVVSILNAFEESDWPAQIDDPITGGGDSSKRRRTVESLNKDLKRIRFSCAGDGLSFRWTILQQPRRRKAKKVPSNTKTAARAAKPSAKNRSAKTPRRTPS